MLTDAAAVRAPPAVSAIGESGPAPCRRARSARWNGEHDIRPVLAGVLGDFGAPNQFERRLVILRGLEPGDVTGVQRALRTV